jgi:putative copper export protein
VGVLLSMGIVLAWTHLTQLSDLWTMTYGRVLSAKVALAMVVFAAGFLNWRKGVPSLDTQAAVRATERRAAWEVCIATGVLLLTAVLVHSVLP